MLRNLTFVWQFAYFSIRPKKVFVSSSNFRYKSNSWLFLKQLFEKLRETFWKISSNLWKTLTAEWRIISSFRTCKSCVYNCDDLLSLNSSLRTNSRICICIHMYMYSHICIKQKRQGWFYSRKHMYIFYQYFERHVLPSSGSHIQWWS